MPRTPANKAHLLGILLALSGVLILSFSGVVVRNLERADSWQIIFYRAMGLVVGLSLLLFIRNRGHVKAVIRIALPTAAIAGPLQAASSMCFILALTHT